MALNQVGRVSSFESHAVLWLIAEMTEVTGLTSWVAPSQTRPDGEVTAASDPQSDICQSTDYKKKNCCRAACDFYIFFRSTIFNKESHVESENI